MEKKISFGFSKLQKKPQLIAVVPKNDDKVELIEGFEDQSVKIIGKVEEAPVGPLVIPMTANTTPLEKVKQLREENRPDKGSAKEKTDDQLTSNGNNTEESLDQRAAREIIENLKVSEEAEDDASKFTVPLTADEVKLGGAKPSSMDDYDNVPIAQFGLAMLRGMGWKDEEHKAKQKSLEDDMIVCRPKGLGLGADKAMKAQVKLATNSTNPNEKQLVMKKGAFVRVVAGKHKDFYGLVEGMDEETGRVFIKFALGGHKESVNEAFVQLVDEKEYKDNRKVLNVAKYEEYKNKEGQGGSSSQKGEKRAEEDSKRDKYSDNRSSSSSRDYRKYDEDQSSKYKKDRRRDRSRSKSQERRKEYSSSSSSATKHSQRSTRDEDDRQRSHRDNKRRERSQSRERKYDHNRRDRRRDEESHKSSSKDNERRRER